MDMDMDMVCWMVRGAAVVHPERLQDQSLCQRSEHCLEMYWLSLSTMWTVCQVNSVSLETAAQSPVVVNLAGVGR